MSKRKPDTPMQTIGVQRCPCSSRLCNTYWLPGIGHFDPGSGFNRSDAELIARLLNDYYANIPFANLVHGSQQDESHKPVLEPDRHRRRMPGRLGVDQCLQGRKGEKCHDCGVETGQKHQLGCISRVDEGAV